MNCVPSNHAVALKVQNAVANNLKQQNLYEEYTELSDKQEGKKITKEMGVFPVRFKDYIWIPHGPVFESENQTATKIRPVFNCLLKTIETPSLNEATYSKSS